MSDLMGGFLSNDSLFGRIMTRLGIIIAANILFVLCTVPVVTAGAGFAALHYTMLKTLRGDGDINPFKVFWRGLKENFKYGTIIWLILLALAVLLRLEWFWCGQFGGFFLRFRFGFLAIGAVALIIGLYLFPVMAAFNAPLKDLVKDSIFFALRKPLNLVVILFFSVFPMILTYTDPQFMPLYGFIWVVCGFSLVCLLTDTLLLKEFEPYLPMVNEYGEIITDGQKK
ncbi:MAG: DUF624 domain-containing protein [Eubacteriales bacterium]|nr:DUF624 domain-containing protein [Eubacteriales bacterium]